MNVEEKREKDRIYLKEWRKRNPEKQREIARRAREKNREKYNELQLAYYHKVTKHNPTEVEKRKQRTKKWVAENHEKWNEYLREYRRRKKASEQLKGVNNG